MNRFGSLGIALAPTAAIVGLALSTPACCCGGGTGIAFSPGPAGTISGAIRFDSRTLPSPATVFAVSGEGYGGQYGYISAHVAGPDYGYAVEVPPGIYTLVARLDSDPAIVAGYSEPVICPSGVNDCNPSDGLKRVRVQSGQTLTGIDVADWGNAGALAMTWNVDLYASRLDITAYTQTPSPLPTRAARYRPISFDGALPLTQTFETGINVTLQLPDGWREVEPPLPSQNRAERYYASQPVRSPRQLAKGGAWLILNASEYVPCNTDQPNWYSSWGLIFPPSQPRAYFYFQDPYDAARHEPLFGYKFMGGGTFAGGGCLGFVFATNSDASREANLATFASIVQQATYHRR